MIEEILYLEEEFANNEYFGTNVWTDEKYRVLSGKYPILLSAPHSVNQLRKDEVRTAEKFTGALTRYLGMNTNTFSIFQLFTHADPNNDAEHYYKNAVVNIIENYNIKFVIDIHSSTFKNEADMDIVTNNKTTLCDRLELPVMLKEIGKKNGLLIEEMNKPNDEKNNEIIASASLIGGVPSLRIVINNKRLDINSEDNKFEAIYNTIEEFVNRLK